jgi:predicted secreted hydrolase
MLRTSASFRKFSSALLITAFIFGSSPSVSHAQKSFKLALPGYRFSFPRDHGSHPQYGTEWWYYTGHLKSKDGRRFGYQLTWFRTALTPRIQRKSNWAVRDVFFAHFALTDEAGRQFFFTDRIGRGRLELAGASSGPKMPRVFIGDWNLQFGGKTGESQSFRAVGQSDAAGTKGQGFALDLKQTSIKPLAIQGKNGVSQKATGLGRASHYYSFTRLRTIGTLTLGNEKLSVEGESWFDHEFGSNQLDKNQVGWDWFSLQLIDGRELMLYRLRLRSGGVEPLSSGTLVEKDGRTRHLKLANFRLTPLENWKSAETGASYPVRWRVEVPRLKLNLEVAAIIPDQELRPRRSGTNLSYWEGSVNAVGSAAGRPVKGNGYLEMTGYASAFENTF